MFRALWRPWQSILHEVVFLEDEHEDHDRDSDCDLNGAVPT